MGSRHKKINYQILDMLQWQENLTHATWEQPLIKPFQLPGLEDLSLRGEGPNSPGDSAGFARHLAHGLYGSGSKATQPSKPWHRQDTWQVKRHEWQPFALCSVETLQDVTISSLFPSCSRPCLAATVPAWALAPVLHTRKFKSNLFASSSFQNKPIPPLLILLKTCYRWVPRNMAASSWHPPLVWHWSMRRTFDTVTHFPWFLCHFCSLPHFSHISLLTLPWEEDKLKHAPELRLQFTPWIWN